MHKKAITLFLVFLFAWGSIFSLSVLASLGATPLAINKDTKKIMSSILPQGWGFFSKNPRDSDVGLYTTENSSSKVVWPNMRTENAFGLYRKGRSQGVEMGAIASTISDKDYTKCDSEDLESCKGKANEITVKNPAPSPLLCGEYFLTKEKPIPWSYFKYSDSGHEITNIVKVDIKCSKK